MTSNNALTRKLEEFARNYGADLFGVADLEPAREFISGQENFPPDRFPRAVSVGMPLNDMIVESHSPEEARRDSLYWFHVYKVVTPALDLLGYRISKWLNEQGFSTFPIPCSTPYNFNKLEGIISHKLVAHLAGLGWIGKSCLLLTDRYGPRVRFVTVLTDAPLQTGSPMDKPCGKCPVCVDVCPVQAVTGTEFRAQDPRQVRFDAPKCSEYRKEHPCGLCVSSCPQGRPRKGRAKRPRTAAHSLVRPIRPKVSELRG
jgi:epoxyqueuosine reductase